VLGVALHQASTSKERDSGTTRTLSMRWSQGYDLEGAITIANDAQQGLRVDGVGLTDNGNLSRLREGIRQCLQQLPEAQRILGHEWMA
jgi:hypothetical protein